MGSELKTPKPTQSANNEIALALDDDELAQLAKFFDALLEADMINKSNERKHE